MFYVLGINDNIIYTGFIIVANVRCYSKVMALYGIFRYISHKSLSDFYLIFEC